MKSYSNYIGIDVHQANSYFIVMSNTGQIKKRIKVPTTESELISVVHSFKKRSCLGFEETGFSQWLYALFSPLVERVVVCNPKHIKEKRGAKSDFRDALEIADLLRVNRIKSVYHSNNPLIKLRQYISNYANIVQQSVSIKNRIHALYRQHGMGMLPSRQRSYKLLPDEASRFCMQGLLVENDLYQKQKEQYKQRFIDLAKKHPEFRLLMTIPGVGYIRAAQIIGIIVTPLRFKTKYKLYSYAKLIRHNQMSDGVIYGKIRAQGNKILKEAFRGAALVSVHQCKNNAFKRYYRYRLTQGLSQREALSATNRKVAAAVYGVWKRNKPYDDNMVNLQEDNWKTESA